MGVGLVPTLHRWLQCLDLGYGFRDVAADAPGSVYAKTRTFNQLHGLAWVWFAVGNCRPDQCQRAVYVAVFRRLDLLAAVEVSDAALGSDCGLLSGVPDRHRTLGLAQLATL